MSNSRMKTNAEYEEDELNRLMVQLKNNDTQSLSDKKEYSDDFKELLNSNYTHFTDHLDHLFDGNLGHGALLKAKQIKGYSDRSNKIAMLFHLLAGTCYNTSQRYATNVYKSLSRVIQDKLNKDIDYYLKSTNCNWCACRVDDDDMEIVNGSLWCDDCIKEKLLTTEQCVESFKEFYPDGIQKAIEDDLDEIHQAWCNYCDGLQKDDKISSEQAHEMEAIDDLRKYH